MSSQRPNSGASRSVVGVRHGRLTRRHPLFSALKFLGISLVVFAVAAVSVVAIDAQRIAAGLKTFELPNETIGPPPDIAAMEGGFNILIVGSDKGETPQEIKDRGKVELNDVTMILHVSQDHTNAVAVSIPRDLVVPIPACPKPDGSGNYARMSAQAINVTLSYGGISCTILTVEALTGLHIDFAGKITFSGVISMSNAVGGVPVCLADDITDKYSGFSRPAGNWVLQGSEALAFLRSRHAVGNGGDLTRISSQQVFLSSLVRTLKSEDTLHDFSKLYSIANAAGTSMELSSNFAHADTLVSVARALADLDLDKVTFVQYPGVFVLSEPGPYKGKVKPVAAVATALFNQIRADQPFALSATGDGDGSVIDPNATPLPTESSSPAAPAGGVPVISGLTGQTAADQTCTKANS